MPLTTTAGTPLGSFCVIDTAPRKWSEGEIEIMRELALSVMTEIELRAHVEERRKQSVALQKAKEEAEAANQAKSIFFANMSHELRTPLSAVIGYSDLLLDDWSRLNETGVVSFLTKIRTASAHLLTLINDTLDLAKIESGHISLNVSTFDVLAVTQELLVSVKPLFDKNDCTLHLNLPTQMPLMQGDSDKIKQILLNLLSNAAKFTPHGNVTLTMQANGYGMAQFIVADEGIGMTSNQIEQIFAPFMQADALTNQTYGGTGLGLAISRQLCQMMGGHIEVQSEVGLGSTFIVTIPFSVPQIT